LIRAWPKLLIDVIETRILEHAIIVVLFFKIIIVLLVLLFWNWFPSSKN
jgi:hypothetical protein